MDVRAGKVKVIRRRWQRPYSQTGHLLFARGDTVLAVPFDPESLETRGAPVAVWSQAQRPLHGHAGGVHAHRQRRFVLSTGSGGRRSSLRSSMQGARSSRFHPSSGRWTADSGFRPTGNAACPIVNARGIDGSGSGCGTTRIPQAQVRSPNADYQLAGLVAGWQAHRLYPARQGRRTGSTSGRRWRRGEADPLRESDDITDLAFPSSWLPDGSTLVLMRVGPGRVSGAAADDRRRGGHKTGCARCCPVRPNSSLPGSPATGACLHSSAMIRQGLTTRRRVSQR